MKDYIKEAIKKLPEVNTYEKDRVYISSPYMHIYNKGKEDEYWMASFRSCIFKKKIIDGIVKWVYQYDYYS